MLDTAAESFAKKQGAKSPSYANQIGKLNMCHKESSKQRRENKEKESCNHLTIDSMRDLENKEKQISIQDTTTRAYCSQRQHA